VSLRKQFSLDYIIVYLVIYKLRCAPFQATAFARQDILLLKEAYYKPKKCVAGFGTLKI
jgi:hypothetical protein